MTETPLQAFVRTNGQQGLEALGIHCYDHPNLPLVGFKYDQLDSPKTDPVVRWARGTVLERGTWNLVAQSFPRFYNFGENAGGEKFDQSNFSATTKEDGSLILLYAYAGEWHVNTSGSFGYGPYEKDNPETWNRLFWRTFNESGALVECLDPQLTYVMELCSPATKVVRAYPTPTLFLLSAFSGNEEVSHDKVDLESSETGIPRPTYFHFKSIDEVQTFLSRRRRPSPPSRMVGRCSSCTWKC
jgi:hypothetical protein